MDKHLKWVRAIVRIKMLNLQLKAFKKELKDLKHCKTEKITKLNYDLDKLCKTSPAGLVVIGVVLEALIIGSDGLKKEKTKRG